jgi:hypothetical protein
LYRPINISYITRILGLLKSGRSVFVRHVFGVGITGNSFDVYLRNGLKGVARDDGRCMERAEQSRLMVLVVRCIRHLNSTIISLRLSSPGIYIYIYTYLQLSLG